MASHPTQPNEQRRRLLKAASAAPVIFTLPVGSSVAAGSVQCDLLEDNTIDNIEIRSSGTRVRVGTPPNHEDYNIIDGTVTIDGQIYRVDDGSTNVGDPDANIPRLVTGSCWTSLITTVSAGSSTNIV